MNKEAKYIINEIRNKHLITSYLSSLGINPVHEHEDKSIYLCPFPSHNETKPSFTVYKKDDGHEDFYCFGCLEEKEKIWSNRGLINIGDINVGDCVVDINGNMDFVLSVNKKTSNNCMSFKSGAFNEPIILTSDHICIAVKREDVIKNLPYIDKRNDSCKSGIRFRKINKCRERGKRYKELTIIQMEAKDLNNEDFLLFPVISDDIRNNSWFLSDSYINKKIHEYNINNIKGPKKKDVDLVINQKTAKFYGLYLAEGSYSGRNIKISMNFDEKNILEELKEIILSEFGLNSKIYEKKEKNTCELNCCSVVLGEKISHLFGKGAKNKKIPTDCLYWDKDIQKEFIKSYFVGDGSKNGKLAVSISRDLLYGMFSVAIQCGLIPKFGIANEEHIDKHGVFHEKSFYLYLREKESIKGFYENIGNTKYYFSIIKDIGIIDRKKTINVVDISVSNTETFLTKLGIVHNCKSSGNIIALYSKINNISWGESIKELSKDIEVFSLDHSEYIVKQLKEDLAKENIEENVKEFFGFLSFHISTMGYAHLCQTNFDNGELIFLESLYKKIDEYIGQEDIDNLIKIDSFISGKNPLKRNLFSFRKEIWAKKQKENRRIKFIERKEI